MGHRVNCDIGIVSFDCYPELQKCLGSIFSREGHIPGHCLVVENSPVDIPIEIKTLFPQVKWFKNENNVGFARACNFIISRSDSNYICLLNPDTVIENGFLAEAISWLEMHPEVAVLGPRILELDGSVQGSARTFPGLRTAFLGRTTMITRFFPNNKWSRQDIITMQDIHGPLEVDWVSGACMIVRRKAIQDVGLLDEGFFMYWEDCDWCRRFKKAGWKVVYHNELGPVIHATGRASVKAKALTLFHFHKSAVRLYAKYDVSPLRICTALAAAGAVLRFAALYPKVLLKRNR